MDPDTAQKALMALSLLVDALAPTNFLPTNPAALQRAFDTAGGQPGQGRQELRRRRASTTAASPARWTPAASRSASTWPARRRRWCTATT